MQAWIAENSVTGDGYKRLEPKSLGHYPSSVRQVLDFCDLTPNPARSPKVKLPGQVGEEVTPPSRDEWLARAPREVPARSETA